jgi:hypothetical protein
MRDRMKTLLIVALAAGCDGGSEPVDAVSSGLGRTFKLIDEVPEPPPDPLLDVVRACEADVTQCDPLCLRILEMRVLGAVILDRCVVEHAPTVHTATIDYHLLCAD